MNRKMTSIEDRAAQWILERDGGELTAEQRTELENWLSADARHREVYLRFDGAWRVSAGLKTWRPIDGRYDPEILSATSNATVASLPRELRQARRGATVAPRSYNAWRRLASAGAALMALAAIATFVHLPVGDRYTTPVGGLQTIPLQDGSRVTLNTDTQLRVEYGKSERRITLLRGEAFFEVTHQASRPFTVQTGGQRIVAVGTQFSVRRDPDDVQVSVTEGTVRLERETRTMTDPDAVGTSTGVELLPAGSVARLSRAGAIWVHREPVSSVEADLSWRTGTLSFHHQSLGKVAAEFNRYNRRQIQITDPNLAAMEFGGNFKSTDLESLVAALRSLNVRTEETSDTIRLIARP